MMRLRRLAVVALALSTTAAVANVLVPSSYDMLNGESSYPGSSIHYYDATYDGSDDNTTDLAPLWDGLGELTDGDPGAHNSALTVAGWEPFVAWRISPTITFHFAQPVYLSEATIYVEDFDGTAGIGIPSSAEFTMGGTTRSESIANPPGSDLRALTFSGLDLKGTQLDLKVYRTTTWTFLSEVEFDGSVIPEPSAASLFALGLATVACHRRRRTTRLRRPPTRVRPAGTAPGFDAPFARFVSSAKRPGCLPPWGFLVP